MLVADIRGIPAMKFWLVCFGLLFVGAELLQWLAELGRQPSGAVLILGGMGLAVVSNAAHLPKLKGAEEDSSDPLSSASPVADSPASQSITRPDTNPALNAAQPERESISFKIRFPFK